MAPVHNVYCVDVGIFNVFLQCESLTGASDRVQGEGIWEVGRGWGDL